MKKALLKGVLLAGLCATFGFGFGVGCATDQPASADTGEQSQGLTSDGSDDFIGGGDSCQAHDGCYSLCRRIHPCGTNPNQCVPLGNCLTECDIEFPTCF